jgi:hypothetical protein
MASLKDKAITLLGSVSGVDMKTAASTAIFTVPANRTLVITHVIVRNNTASLAGGTSYSVTGFRQAFSLNAITATTTNYILIQGTDITSFTVQAASTVINWTVTTGATAAGTATIDIFGYLY